MRTALRLFLSSALLWSAACGTEDSFAPSLASSDFRPMKEIVDPAVTVDVLQRLTPLHRNVTKSVTISRKGGTIKLPEGGLTIEIPANAFESPEITFHITALAGSDVAYDFEPHGLVFTRPINVFQDLKVTSFDKHDAASLEGAYFADMTSLQNGSAKVNEFKDTHVDLKNSKLRFPVDHFSGYLVSSSRRR